MLRLKAHWRFVTEMRDRLFTDRVTPLGHQKKCGWKVASIRKNTVHPADDPTEVPFETPLEEPSKVKRSAYLSHPHVRENSENCGENSEKWPNFLYMAFICGYSCEGYGCYTEDRLLIKGQ